MSKDTNLKNPHWDIQELTVKTQIQKDNFERSKRKKVVTYKGSPLPIRQLMDFFSRNIIGKGNIIKRNRNVHPFLEGKGCYIQIPGGKCNTRIKHLAKLLFENKGETKDFISQTKVKESITMRPTLQEKLREVLQVKIKNAK